MDKKLCIETLKSEKLFDLLYTINHNRLPEDGAYEHSTRMKAHSLLAWISKLNDEDEESWVNLIVSSLYDFAQMLLDEGGEGDAEHLYDILAPLSQEQPLTEAKSKFKFFELTDERGRNYAAVYRNKTQMINCVGFMIGRRPEINSEVPLPDVVTEAYAEKFPEYVAIWGGNPTWNYDIYQYIVGNKLGAGVGNMRGDYIVKNYDAIMDYIKSKSIPVQQTGHYKKSPVGEKFFWDEMIIRTN